MLAVVCFFLIISAGSVFCSAILGKKYEETLPISCAAIVFVLFVSGLLGRLNVGAAIVCVLSVFCYIIAVLRCIKNRNTKTLVRNTFTGAFWIYVVFCIVIVASVYGKVLNKWDEISHWGTIVKAMAMSDDFGTNPSLNVMFRSYPPGMGLFQYMLEKINVWLTAEIFCEWQLYVSYQMFLFAFIMPFFARSSKKNIIASVVGGITVFVAPLVFYCDIYSSLYIDPFLGALSGTGLAMILLKKEKDIFYTLRIVSICSILVLAKDAGIFFAIMISLFYILDVMTDLKHRDKKTFFSVLGVVLSVAIPKLLWEMEIKIHRIVKLFNGEVDFGQLVRIILLKDDTYKSQVWSEFWRAFIRETVEIGQQNVQINYVWLLIILFSILLVVAKLLKKKVGAIILAVILQTTIYILGLVISYIFKFSEYEALNLASYERYMNINCLSILMLVIISSVSLLYDMADKRKNLYILLFGMIIIILTPSIELIAHFAREPVHKSVAERTVYESVAQKVEKQTEVGANVYLIVQESAGYEFHVMKYLLLDRDFNSGEWSIGEPCWEGDIWAVKKDADEWMNDLCENYDYVILYNINEYFRENYSHLFKDEKVCKKALYRVNKSNQTLEFVG